jgi:hypothetical protein
MPRALKVALTCVAIVSVASVLISPDLEADGVLPVLNLISDSATLVRASAGRLLGTHRRYLTSPLVLLYLDKPAFVDLTCARRC